ncbi:Dipeptidyl aminopeptidase/acylaminoacyl peptidase [Verrucomicrobium sp. GAS474]|uniref:S9 family peptidase n=1 Tax=Verrucomicrobium sp. GAS474 TaxID=1882831 RepID=UPI00087CFCA4|nr:prolyl oligopeptidase family serine peptidase [Verrucomicrobium sp. GAS474]SDU25583.1 Dipeptidyl aminopeptidase/acylaminoacyl peptidase [Verrucomicrobium sp. GAS474]
MKALFPLAFLALTSSLLADTPAPAAADAIPGRVEKGNLVMENIPAIPPALSDRLLQYQSTRGAGLAGWEQGPNAGSLLILTRFAETAQVHRVAGPGMDRQQLTFFKEPIGGAFPRPIPAGSGNAPGFLYLKDVGGNENHQIHFFNSQTGLSTLLTDTKTPAKHGGIRWAHKGNQYAYYDLGRNGRDWDLYAASPDDAKSARLLLANAGAWVPLDWSPDDRRLLVMHEISATESYLFVLDISSKKLTPVHPTKTKISYGDARWSPDGKGIYLTSDEGSEFHRLVYFDLDKEKLKSLTDAIPWDVDEIETSPEAGLLAFTTNEGGVGKLYLLDPKTQEYQPAADIPVGQVGGLSFSPDGTKLGLTLNSPQNPADVYVLTLAQNSSERSLQRWTNSEVGGLNTATFPVPTLIAYDTFDTVPSAPGASDTKPRQIPAFYYKPAKADAKSPAPVVILIHGGPEGQFTPGFSAMIPFYVNELGIALLVPNVRGSSGYGKSYLDLDNGEKREDSVKDIGALLDWIAKQPELDAKRVIVSGGSYGGYMVLASLIHYPDQLRAGIEEVGITHFVTFLKNTEDYRRDLRRVEYGDERDPRMALILDDISPLTHAEKLTRPLFIVAGGNDPRVPASEAEQLVAALKKNKQAPWYLLAKDEGHGFAKKSNRDFLGAAKVLFLQENLTK